MALQSLKSQFEHAHFEDEHARFIPNYSAVK
jgi:hypothetical protein